MNFLSEAQIIKKLHQEGIPACRGDIFNLEREGLLKGYVFKKKAKKFIYQEAKDAYLRNAEMKGRIA